MSESSQSTERLPVKLGEQVQLCEYTQVVPIKNGTRYLHVEDNSLTLSVLDQSATVIKQVDLRQAIAVQIQLPENVTVELFWGCGSHIMKLNGEVFALNGLVPERLGHYGGATFAGYTGNFFRTDSVKMTDRIGKLYKLVTKQIQYFELESQRFPSECFVAQTGSEIHLGFVKKDKFLSMNADYTPGQAIGGCPDISVAGAVFIGGKWIGTVGNVVGKAPAEGFDPEEPGDIFALGPCGLQLKNDVVEQIFGQEYVEKLKAILANEFSKHCQNTAYAQTILGLEEL